MATFDLPSSVPTSGGKINGAWMNRILDAIRRRTPIQGRGVRCTSTPNGTIITLENAVKSGSGGDTTTTSGGVYPFALRRNNAFFEVYIPNRGAVVNYYLRTEADGGAYTNVPVYSVLNAAGSEADWYILSPLSMHATLGRLIQPIVVDIFTTSSGIQIGVRYESSGMYNWDVPTSFTERWTMPIGIAYWEDSSTLSGVIGTHAGDLQLIEDLSAKQYATQIQMSPTDATLVYNRIVGIENAIGGGGYTLSDATPKVDGWDDDDGSAGVSDSASRGDHSHPLNVGTGEPSPIPVHGLPTGSYTGGFEGIDGTYARSDHTHPFPLIVGNREAVTEELVDASQLNPDGLGGSTGATGEITQLGDVGVSPYAAALDHSHPLNVVDDTNDVQDIMKVGSGGATAGDLEMCLGSAFTYARADHTHPLSGVPWLANDSALPTGATASVALFPDEGSDPSGYIGAGTLAVPYDHKHPLNINPLDTRWGTAATGEGEEDTEGDSATGIIQPIGMFAKFGTSQCYCREDHHHPIPTDGEGATGIYSPSGSAYPQATGDMGGLYYGTGFDATWNRDANFATGGEQAGLTMSVVCAIKNVTDQYGQNVLAAFFRTITFDAYGCAREVSAVTHGMRMG